VEQASRLFAGRTGETPVPPFGDENIRGTGTFAAASLDSLGFMVVHFGSLSSWPGATFLDGEKGVALLVNAGFSRRAKN
jgi:hypothetical protein